MNYLDPMSDPKEEIKIFIFRFFLSPKQEDIDSLQGLDSSLFKLGNTM